MLDQGADPVQPRAPLTIAADADGWVERHAIAQEDQPAWLPGSLAERLHTDGLGQLPARLLKDRTGTEHDGFTAAGTPEPPPLVLRGGHNSTSHCEDAATASSANPLDSESGRTEVAAGRLRKLIRAAQKVDAAHRLLHQQLLDRARAPTGDWTGGRARALRQRADAVERRRQQTELCVSGRDFVAVYRCDGCGQRQQGVPLTCHSRVCPRCVALIRNRATAHLHDLLELCDARRKREGKAPPRWRFLTLTVPSTPHFLPQRRWLGKAWGRLLRREFWGDRVRAALCSLETTHTRAGWHVHLHALVDAFLPRPQLVREWQDACLRELLADAAPHSARKDRKRTPRLHLWRGVPLHPETALAAKALLRWGRRVPAVLEGSSHRVDLNQEASLERDIELQDLVQGGMVLRWSSDVRDEWDNPIHQRLVWPSVLDGVPAAVRPLVADQLDQLLAMLPKGAGVYIKEATGDRASIIRELAKYLAKDLGGSTSADEEEEWGVAGTIDRLAEFLDGSFRWRVLRTYGDLYHAGQELDQLQNGQCCCACGGSLAWDQVVVIEPGQRVSLPRCGHAAERLSPAPRAGPPAAALTAADP